MRSRIARGGGDCQVVFISPFGCSVTLNYEDEQVSTSVNSHIAERTEFWWNERKPDEPVLWQSKIRLGWDFFW